MLVRSLTLLLTACAPDPLPVDPAPAVLTAPTDTGDPGPELYDPPVRAGTTLPAGVPLTAPLESAFVASFDAIDSAGGAPIIEYRTEPGTFNVQRTIRANEVRTSRSGQYADLDLGPMRVRVANYTTRNPGFPVLRVQANTLAGLVVLRSYSRPRTSTGALSSARLDLVSVLPQASTSPLAKLDLATQRVQLSQDCEALAWEQADEVPPLAVSFPPFSGCSLEECIDTKAAWIRAWHDVWRVRQMLDYMAQRDGEVREFLWSQPGANAADVPLGEDTSLVHWFGDFSEYRFDAIRWAFDRLWDDMHDHDLGGLQLDIECTPSSGADICNTSDAPAHHAVKSNIKVCTEFWDADEDYRALLMVHEPLHHVFVPWNSGTPRSDPIMDTHTHGHGLGCGLDVKTEKSYGINKVRHLATYENSSDFDCWHRNYAFRNNDSYGWSSSTIGAGVRRGTIHHWPAEHWPPDWEPDVNPNVPACSQPGFDPPPPGGQWEDPLDDCVKIGQELVCPGGGGGAGGGMTPELDLAIECPPEL